MKGMKLVHCDFCDCLKIKSAQQQQISGILNYYNHIQGIASCN